MKTSGWVKLNNGRLMPPIGIGTWQLPASDELVKALVCAIQSGYRLIDTAAIFENEESVAWLLQQILNYIKILGPILVVILSSMDFAKAIIASDDESMKKAEKKLMIRLVLAVALFLVPTLVSVMLSIFGYTSEGQLCLLK